MKQPIRTCKQFDVVIVPFPFTDQQAVKRRPALVISERRSFNQSQRRSVMAMITTATHPSWALDVPIQDLQPTGLNVASIVRMKLFTLEHKLVIRKIGVLALGDQSRVSDALRSLMKLM
jgi:mRNA interferase MazF